MYFVYYKEYDQNYFEEFKTKKELLEFIETLSKGDEDYFDIKKYKIIEGKVKKLCVKEVAIKFDVE